jgi:hypothetical protein
MLTPAERTLLQQHVEIDGDGNIVGDGNTIIHLTSGDYAIQIGQLNVTLSLEDLLRILTPPLDREAALAQYRERILRRHGTTRIFGLPEAVSVEGIFTHLNILEKPRAWERASQRKGQRVEGLAYVTEAGHDRLLILGKPGAGKTTFLRYLACQAARGVIDRVPVLVALKDWAMQGGTLLDALAHEFVVCGVPDAEPLIEDLLAEGRLLLLFDALDEVPEAKRPRLLTALRDAGDQYPQCQILITCRTAATEYQFERFQTVEVADFDETQVQTFIGKWFQHDPAQGKALWRALNEDQRRGVLQLARMPLLLALFCIVFAELGELPIRRVELYREALDVLVKRWNRSKALPLESVTLKLSPARKHALFAHLAYHTFTEDVVTFSQERAETLIGDYLRTLPVAPALLDVDLEDVLHELEAQHGILVQTAQRIYTFAHLTFQEYYTARYVEDSVVSGDMGAIRRLLTHAHEDRWREVILITASLLQNADVFFDHFLDALVAIVAPHARLVEFLAWSARKAASVTDPYRLAAVRSFYSFLVLKHGCDPALSFNLDLAQAQALTRDRALARDGAPDFSLTLDLDRVFTQVLDHARVGASARACDLAHASIVSRFIVQTLARNSAHDLIPDLASTRDLAERLNLSGLSNALTTLKRPTNNDPPEVWDTFATDLQALMIEHRDIGHDWGFTKEQVEALERYFYAARLLVDCLDVATVTDRDAILDRLLLPPEPDAVTENPPNPTKD